MYVVVDSNASQKFKNQADAFMKSSYAQSGDFSKLVSDTEHTYFVTESSANDGSDFFFINDKVGIITINEEQDRKNAPDGFPSKNSDGTLNNDSPAKTSFETSFAHEAGHAYDHMTGKYNDPNWNANNNPNSQYGNSLADDSAIEAENKYRRSVGLPERGWYFPKYEK